MLFARTLRSHMQRHAGVYALAGAGGAFLLSTTLSEPVATHTASPAHQSELVHFRATNNKHPLDAKPREHRTWDNPTQNYIWTDEELDEVLSSEPVYIPVTNWDHVTHGLVRFCYRFFNFISGYDYDNPTLKSLELRVIFLESVAGIPGMVAAQHRHFRSLRTMERDYGWIHTLLEEAENERMHLLTFMQMFEPSWGLRMMVQLGQFAVAVPYIALYVTNPKAAHRFVGYLEETAVHTYCDIIRKMQVEDTHLQEWNRLKPPQIAIDYWRLDQDATFLDVVKVIAADETHHRDVNHTFAGMESDDPNPFVQLHHESAKRAWQFKQEENLERAQEEAAARQVLAWEVARAQPATAGRTTASIVAGSRAP